MSKQVTKILVSCALVVCLLLAIAGTVVASYFSFGTILNVEIYLNEVVKAEQTDSSVAPFAQVRYNGKEVNKTLSVAHVAQVDLDVLSKGYTFVGWFKGTKAEYQAKLNSSAGVKETDWLKADEKTNRLSFTASDYSDLVAVFDIVEYNVTFNYYAKGSEWKSEGSLTDAQPTGSGRYESQVDGHYYYGQRISETLNSVDEPEYRFLGWQIEGDETNRDYQYATFVLPEDNDGTITLNAHWRDTQAVTISYYNTDGSLLTTEDVSEIAENYTLSTPETLEGKLANLTLDNGYRYFWTTAAEGGSEVAELTDLANDVNVYLNREIITYTAKVESDEFNLATYNKAATFTFTVESYDKLTEVVNNSNWTKQYTFHMVSGVSYDNGTYNTESSIFAKIFETNAHKAMESEILLTPVVSGYKTIKIGTIEIKVLDEISDGIPEGEPSKAYYESGNECTFSGNAQKGLVSAEGALTIYELFNLQGITLYSSASADSREEVTLRAVKVDVGLKTEGVVVNGNSTVFDLIEQLIALGELTNGGYHDVLEITTFTLLYCPVSVQ